MSSTHRLSILGQSNQAEFSPARTQSRSGSSTGMSGDAEDQYSVEQQTLGQLEQIQQAQLQYEAELTDYYEKQALYEQQQKYLAYLQEHQPNMYHSVIASATQPEQYQANNYQPPPHPQTQAHAHVQVQPRAPNPAQHISAIPMGVPIPFTFTSAPNFHPPRPLPTIDTNPPQKSAPPPKNKFAHLTTARSGPGSASANSSEPVAHGNRNTDRLAFRREQVLALTTSLDLAAKTFQQQR